MDNNSKNLHDIVDTSEDVYKTKKVKDSSLLLKQKMCKTHDLIKQYTEKVREIDCLKSERNLEVTKKDANYLKSKYKSVIDETKKLEHQIVEDKLKNEKLIDQIKEYEVNTAADKQVIQQLTCKVKELEEKCTAKIKEYGLLKSTLQGKIKSLENELQKSKVTPNRKQKKITPNNLDTSKLSLQTKSTSDIGVNVSLCDELNTKPEVQERGIVTDKLHNINDHPLLCTNCESQMPLVLTPEKICKAMCTYPELIERNFSPPREIVSSPCLVPNTYPDSTDRHDAFSRTLSESRMSLCSQDNDSIADNRKSESVFHTMSTTRQNCENNELKNTNIIMDKSDKWIATKPSSNLGPIFETSALQQNMNCTREDSYSSYLLAKHSLSIEEIKKQIRLLQGRVKKIEQLKEKPNTNSCRIMNYNDSTLLNSDLFAIICKGISEHFNNGKKTCSTNVQEAIDIGLRSNRETKLKRRRLNKYNKAKSASLWKIEDIDERYSRDTLHNSKSEDTMKVAACDILQSKRNVCIDKSNAISYASSEFLNDIDGYDKRESFSCDKEIDASSSAEEMSVEGDLTTSHLNTDNLYDSIEKISNNSLNEDNANSVDMDYQEKVQMKISSCNSDCIDDADNKTIDIIPEENKVKRKSQNKAGYGDRLFKKIRSLKRKVQVNSHVNNEESSELYSDHYKPTKKLRIAHIPKTAILQSPNVDQEDFTPCNVKSTSNLKASREKCQRLNVQILKNNLLTENKEDCTISKKCDEKSAVECGEINRIDDKRSAAKIQEDNSVSINSESCPRNNNFALSVMDIESAFAISEFDKRDDILVEDISKESTSTEKITVEVSRNCDELEVSDDIPDNATKEDSSNLEKSIPIKAQVIIQSESSVPCKDSKCDTYKFTENLQVKASDITRKGITPNVELEYICNTSRDESCNNYETPKNMDRNDESMSNQSESINVIEATGHENRNNNDLPNKVSKAQHLQKDSEIIIENYCTDNDNGSVDESFNKARNTLGKQGEVYANDKITEIQTVEFQRVNVCMNQQDKETKVINPYDDVEQFQTPMSQLNKYINTKYIKYKPVKKKNRIHNCTITDRFVKKQLKRLINSDWDNSVHYDVIQKLASTCGPRIIAKCIVEFLLNDVDHDEPLDKSFTPPAPLMATSEQKITALLIDLEVSKPTVLHFVHIAIEYKLFKLNSDVKSQTEWVESLTRMCLVLSRIQKDRERVRIMCCNALYCMNLTSINVLYTVFTSWPEVLPNAEINKEILPTCLAFLIGSQYLENKPSQKILKKLIALKTLVSTFYKYNNTKQTRDDVAKELMTLLKAKRTNGLDTAIILFAKKQGPSWTYKNIIKSDLLPMIINYEHPCIYSAFSLLGKLMRPFENEDNIVQEICEQLCDLIQSGQGTHDQQEGIISALLSLSRQKFDVVAPSIIRWAPNKSLRPTVIAHLQAFISTHDRKFWTSYLQRIESK